MCLRFLLWVVAFLICSPLMADSYNYLKLNAGQVTGAPVVINVTDPAYGALCNGTTDDTAAINAAFAAARISSAYTSNRPVVVMGPGIGKPCLTTSGINATGFTTNNAGSKLVIQSLALSCSGAGVICIDMIGDLWVEATDLAVFGSSSTPPYIGVQIGTINPSASPCCIQTYYGTVTGGNFSFASVYNASAESVSWYGSAIRNSGASTGSLNTLGTITGGSGYTNNTYTNVPLTGGVCTDNPKATVVVSGGAVSSVTLTYEGHNCATSDTYTTANGNIGGSGSGFSVPAATIKQFALVMDGENYWNLTSANQTITWTRNTYYTFSQNNMYGGSLRYTDGSHNGSPLWVGAVIGAKFFHTYLANLSGSGSPCIDLFDNGAFSNTALYFDARCETLTVTYGYYLYGSNATPSLPNATFISDYEEETTALLGTAANITAVTMNNANIQLQGAAVAHLKVFASPLLWTVTGNVSVGSAGYWNYPLAFHGTVTTPSSSASNKAVLSVGDVLPYISMAGGVRLLVSTYTGPLINVINETSSQALDIYPDANGDLDKATFEALCNNVTCKVTEVYDQTVNTNNCTQSTDANRPVITYSTAMNNRPIMTFGDASAVSLGCGTGTWLGNIWGTNGGYAEMVANQTGNTTVADRFIYKGGGSVGWDWYIIASGSQPEFLQGATGTLGVWVYTTIGTGAHIYEAFYNNTNVANLPAINANGASSPNTSAQQPSGSMADDHTLPLVIGNTVTTGGNRGFPGSISEFMVVSGSLSGQPDAGQLDAIRRNQATYYGISSVP